MGPKKHLRYIAKGLLFAVPCALLSAAIDYYTRRPYDLISDTIMARALGFFIGYVLIQYGREFYLWLRPKTNKNEN